jgi:hypothetical protein
MYQRSDLSSSLGFYTPTFFRIHLDTDIRPGDFRQYSAENAAIFLHEYIHFLQDLTTIYGLMNISFIVDYIKTVNVNQRKLNNRNLQIPYLLTPDKDGVTYYNSELQKIYYGTTDSIAFNVNELVVSEKDVPVLTAENSITTKKVPQYQLVGRDDYDEAKVYYFGSHSILESMAFLIERSVMGAVLPQPPMLPYTAASIVGDKLLPGLSNYPLSLVAICDVALMNFHPADAFVKCVNFIKDENISLADHHKLHQIIYSAQGGVFLGFDQTPDLFNYMSVSSAGQISSYFTTDVYGQNKIWFDHLFTSAAILRRKYPNLFLLIAEGGPLADNKPFHHVYSKLGLPMTTNSRHHATFAPVIPGSSIRPDMLWAIEQIFRLYLNSAKSQLCRCNLITWCQESCEHQQIPDYTDQRCWDAPWLRVNDIELCTFAQVWKTWGMENEIPTV